MLPFSGLNSGPTNNVFGMGVAAPQSAEVVWPSCTQLTPSSLLKIVKVWPLRCRRHQALGYLGLEFAPAMTAAAVVKPPVVRRRFVSQALLPAVPITVTTGLTWIFW